jgi:hypothetical protein
MLRPWWQLLLASALRCPWQQPGQLAVQLQLL